MNLQQRKEKIKKLAAASTYKAAGGVLLADLGELYEFGVHSANYTAKMILTHLTITAGSITGRAAQYYNEEKKQFVYTPSDADTVADALGLAYTSCSGFAAFWVCNVETVLTVNNNLKLRGFAFNEKMEDIILLEDKDENYFYFKDYELLNYIDEVTKL